MFTRHSRNFRAIGRNTSISEEVYVIVQFCTIWQRPDRKEVKALFLYLLVTSQDITPDRVFAEYHKIIEFCSEVTIYQNVFSLRPRSSSAITKKLQEIKGKLKVDEELFKKQIQYNWFFD